MKSEASKRNNNISIYTAILVASYLVTYGFAKTNIYQVFMTIYKE